MKAESENKMESSEALCVVCFNVWLWNVSMKERLDV